MTNPSTVSPWYKQPWLWFILAPLIATVLYSIVFISASIFTHDSLVKEDYYKHAREVNQDNTKLEVAEELGLSATINVDSVTGDLNVVLSSDKNATMPSQLVIEFIHATLQDKDLLITLKQVQGGIYVGSLAAPLQGRQQILLQPQDQSWQLRDTVYPPYDQLSIHLSPTKAN